MTGALATKARGGGSPAAAAPAPVAIPGAAAVLSALPTPTVVLDGENRFRFANPAAEGFFGLSAPTLAALGLADLLPEDGRLFALLAQVRAIARYVRELQAANGIATQPHTM